MNIQVSLSDEDIDSIATAVAAKLAGSDPKAVPPKAATKATKAKPAAETEPPKVDYEKLRAAVLDKARTYAKTHGKDASIGLIHKYGQSFNDVKDADLEKLNADLDKAPPADDDNFGL